MPIKGLTTRQDLTPRFPRLGKLRKGGEKVVRKNAAGKEYETYGHDLDHFRFTSEQPEVEAAFLAAYGEKPVNIACYLPYPTMEQNFQTWKEEWGSGGLKHRCDGERTVIWQNEKGEYVTDPDKQKPCPGKCDELGRLELMIPELLEAGYVGTVTLETHSLNDIISISESLLKTEEMRNDHIMGLRGIRFSLRRVKEKISTPGFGDNKGKRQRVDKWLVKLEPATDWVQLQIATMHRLAFEDVAAPLQITADSEQFARIGPDQMESLINQTERLRELEQQPIEQRRADAWRGVEAMRGPKDFEGFGDEPELHPLPTPDDVVDADYRPVPTDDEMAADFDALAGARGEPDAQPHWIEDSVTSRRFWAFASDRLGFGAARVREILGVEAITDYQGTKREALEALQKAFDEALVAQERERQAKIQREAA
jgi:hypothetical protein